MTIDVNFDTPSISIGTAPDSTEVVLSEVSTIEVDFNEPAPLGVDFTSPDISIEFSGGSGGSSPLYDRESDYDSTSLNFFYTGAAIPGSLTSAAVWKISRYNMAAGLIEYANGNENFINEYDERENLSYT